MNVLLPDIMGWSVEEGKVGVYNGVDLGVCLCVYPGVYL